MTIVMLRYMYVLCVNLCVKEKQKQNRKDAINMIISLADSLEKKVETEVSDKVWCRQNNSAPSRRRPQQHFQTRHKQTSQNQKSTVAIGRRMGEGGGVSGFHRGEVF